MRKIQDEVVCVVGGCGFLGSHLVRYLLQEKNCKVVVIDNLVTGRREFLPDYEQSLPLGGAAMFRDRLKFEYYDITKSESYLWRVFKYNKVRYVFNYAAEPYIPVSFARPLHVCEVNFMGALQVINAAQEAGCAGILQVSSAEIYGENSRHDDGKLDELDHVVPHSSYGASKAAIDALIQVRWREAKTPCIALRQFNCIGERETHPYVVPEIISQLAKHPEDTRSVTVRLGNNSSRDFQYAGDAVRMAVSLLEHGEFGEVYNMGSEDSIKIYDLAAKIGELMGHSSVKIEQDPARVRPWEIWHLQSDNTKLYRTIPERPQVSLDAALERTIKDYRNSNYKWSWER